MMNNKKSKSDIFHYNFFPKSRRASIEMSMGTIIAIVLGVTLLIGGIFFIQKITNISTGVADLSEEALRDEVSKLFSEEKEVIIYPATKVVQIKQDSTDGIGLGIKNLLQGAEGDTLFSYETIISDASDCEISEEQVSSWIIGEGKEENIPIASGDLMVDKIMFRIPVGAPLCVVKCRINVYYGSGEIYKSESFFIEVKAK